ncbi:transmembrane protein, putative [Medicago truncatula]|uniref:Transmembrane protein, putative n=1 Tax=Medicago truncatula TaxID=3880 RepID=A0A072TWH1_MEDTR|nr:transmembrane protein, putative [Medicago truncatula]
MNLVLQDHATCIHDHETDVRCIHDHFAGAIVFFNVRISPVGIVTLTGMCSHVHLLRTQIRKKKELFISGSKQCVTVKVTTQ